MIFITPSYGSVEGYLLSLLCVILFVILFVCTVMDFSAAEKAMGVKFCMHVGLLSGQVFSPLEVRGQGHQGQKTHLVLRSPTRLPYEWYARAANGSCCGAGGQAHFVVGEGWHRRWRAPRLATRGGGVKLSTKAVWWGMHLASLLMYLFSKCMLIFVMVHSHYTIMGLI